MLNLKSIISVKIAIIYFVAIIIIAHFLTPAEYNWKVNTISDLAAQQYNNAWLMRIGFIGFGILMCIAVFFSFFQSGQKNYSDFLIIIYALSVSLSGIWSTAPFFETQSFSIQEDNLHSLFAQMAGIAFSFAILWHMLVYSDPKHKLKNFIFFILVIGFPALVGLAKNEMIAIGLGLIQRGLYLVSFIWLIIRFR